jgi:hypothetical protein
VSDNEEGQKMEELNKTKEKNNGNYVPPIGI